MKVRSADLRALDCNALLPMSLLALDPEQPRFVTRGESAPRTLQKSLPIIREQQALAG